MDIFESHEEKKTVKKITDDNWMMLKGLVLQSPVT